MEETSFFSISSEEQAQSNQSTLKPLFVYSIDDLFYILLCFYLTVAVENIFPPILILDDISTFFPGFAFCKY